jgi:hypothetical protein
MTGMQPWENPPASWEAAAVDDHGSPAIWTECDGCRRWSWCLYGYTEAVGPCELDPDYEERLREAGPDYEERLRWPAIPGIAELRAATGLAGCDNCAAVIAFCSLCMPAMFRPGVRP